MVITVGKHLGEMRLWHCIRVASPRRYTHTITKLYTENRRVLSQFYYFCGKIEERLIMIDQIIAFNKTFVAQKGYEKYLTDKYPDKKLAVLSCMDTRLTELLPAALGLKNGDAKIIKNAGGLVISAFDSAMRSLIVAIYELGVEEIMVVAHSHCGACHMSYDHFHHEMIARGVTDETLDTIRKCGIDLDHWLEGFKDTPTSVRKTVETIKTHPLVPKDIVVRGFIIDSETGALEEID